MTYATAIAARRAFRLPGYVTLADEGFDGDYVCPIHMTSGNCTGPLLISKDWLDVPSVRQHRDTLHRLGYLPQIIYNRVMDMALALLRLTRADVYISPIFHLLTPRRSSAIRAADARASFDAIGRHELMGRRPVALGHDRQCVPQHFGIAHVAAPHPSARQGSFADRARHIAAAIEAAQ